MSPIQRGFLISYLPEQETLVIDYIDEHTMRCFRGEVSGEDIRPFPIPEGLTEELDLEKVKAMLADSQKPVTAIFLNTVNHDFSFGNSSPEYLKRFPITQELVDTFATSDRIKHIFDHSVYDRAERRTVFVDTANPLLLSYFSKARGESSSAWQFSDPSLRD